MAFPVVQSTAASSRTSNGGPFSSGTVIRASLPASLAVGDLMVAFCSSSDQAASTPSGWTVLSTSGNFQVFWKLADSGDVSAGTVDITCMPGSSNTEGASIVITRITGHDATTPIQTSHFTATATTSSPTDTGITPTPLQVLFLISAMGFNTTASRTTSGYSVTTSNPSWTEVADQDVTGAAGARHCLSALAWANQTANPGVATSTVSATFSGSETNAYLGIVAVQPSIASQPTSLSATFTLNAPTIARAMVVAALSFVGSLGIPTVSEVANKWANLAKNSSSWNDLNKTP